jgi:hypothetical protein
MIVNLYVSVDLAIALFTLAVGSYAALKAYKIEEGAKTTSNEQRYEQEKSFYLVSTVGWMTLGTRILAIPLFWLTVVSLIPSVPGAMCEYGVFQAGSPYSWANFVLKFVTMFAFGGWLFFDFMNRKMKGSPLMGSLSRWFVLLVPLLFIDALLDLSFFGLLKPLVVPCCMVAYSGTANSLFNIGCPFCFVTYKFPLLWGVIAMYASSLALVVWSFLFQHSTRKLGNARHEVTPVMRKVLLAAVILAVIGTVLLLMQVSIGSFSSV